MIKHRNNCRGCFSTNVYKFLSLGKMPLAGGFISPDKISREQKFPLDLYYCKTCGLVQILDIIDPEILFKHYFYLSSVIQSLSYHFKNYAYFLKKNYLKLKGSKLLEFGCNDGVLLQYLNTDKHIKVYGIDPSDNISQIARNKGLSVWTDYFNQKSALKIRKEIGTVDVVTGSNVFAHVNNIHEIIKAAKLLLKPSGVFIVEVHYLKVLLDEFQYDTIYHEHLCYYSITALKNIFALRNMKIIDIFPLKMHGGGIRIVVANNSSLRKIKPIVATYLRSERSINLQLLQKFEKKALQHRKNLLNILIKLKAQKKKIVGYGAPGRGTILLNYCGIDQKYLDYIVDASPLRAGMLMPGVHVAIYSPQMSRQSPPDYFLVLAWNYIESIRDQEKDLIKKGVKFIVPFPKIKII